MWAATLENTRLPQNRWWIDSGKFELLDQFPEVAEAVLVR
jgi:hypothetical protein